jgi:hypothetical protein
VLDEDALSSSLAADGAPPRSSSSMAALSARTGEEEMGAHLGVRGLHLQRRRPQPSARPLAGDRRLGRPPTVHAMNPGGGLERVGGLQRAGAEAVLPSMAVEAWPRARGRGRAQATRGRRAHGRGRRRAREPRLGRRARVFFAVLECVVLCMHSCSAL